MFIKIVLIALACMIAGARTLPRVSRRTRAVGKSYEPDPSEVFPSGFENMTPPLENLPTADISRSSVHSRPLTSRLSGTKIRNARQAATFYFPETDSVPLKKSVYNERKPRSPRQKIQNYRGYHNGQILSRKLRDTASSLHAGEDEDGNIPDEVLDSELHDHEYHGGLVHPDMRLCLNRYKGFESKVTGSTGELSYVISSDHPQYYIMHPETGGHIDIVYTWLEARNECRKRCMELVSINTIEENVIVKHMMKDNKVGAVWTAGRLCDGTFCNATRDMEPLRENGWVWSNNNEKLSTEAIPEGFEIQPWSHTGSRGERQPDNNSGFYGRGDENCIAMLVNNFFDDGTKWSDARCNQRMHFICEDSEELLEDVQRDLVLREE